MKKYPNSNFFKKMYCWYNLLNFTLLEVFRWQLYVKFGEFPHSVLILMFNGLFQNQVEWIFIFSWNSLAVNIWKPAIGFINTYFQL